ncbi:MAG: Methyltransferase type 12 [Parcubacteria group bacterium GW2011_GWA1_47_10]|uniref:Methyltransferase type 12 n=1 Tax=Candidatus Nomurabacteria bacterium GW2011_GWB1_47_6 TaxID=1618749 RepID=A0A0G1VZN5_9BACT|nr:MAG: Methyltransferase type 12 [Parcubacteria group bacterium GW2011_GWA1_47_10]KKU75530.1 MAG: Methyltransferase type 12 [Candidatus Nomurabacteria bacterium GW2011_GWB1_47_6]HXK35915.1 class I SAM-dependent methyltransferase [Candidatus Paceibacterota bacterium]
MAVATANYLTMRELFKDYRIFSIDPAKLRSRDFFQNMLDYRKIVMRRYKQAIRPNGQFRCLLCGGRRAQPFLRHQNYQLFECKQCGLVSPNIDLAKVDGQELYDDPVCVADTKREVLDTYEYRKKTYAPERLKYLLEKTGLRPRSLRLLDIGCGPGYFLSHLKDQNIRAKGLELADFLIKICQAKGLQVEKADLDKEPDRAYNAITMFDVLEHIANPLPFMRNVHKKLRPGGYVLAYIPNIHSLAFHLMRDQQNTLQPFQHLCFYDPASLSHLAKKTGFKIHSLDYYGLDLMDYFYMKEASDPIGYHRRLSEIIPWLQAIVDKQKLSNHMRVVFKKK